jgi:hypothetical protein
VAKKISDAMPDTSWPTEDRSFEEQMDDLGVKIIKPEKEISWYEPNFGRSGRVGLKDKVSIHSSGLTIGSQAIDQIGTTSKLKIGIIKVKNKSYVAIKMAEDGLTITKTKVNSFRVGTKKLSEWLLKEGIEKGKYVLKAVDGGFILIPEGE